MNKKTVKLLPFVFFFIIIVLMMIAASVGIQWIPAKTVFQVLLLKLGFSIDTDISSSIILTVTELRLPRIVMSIFAGAALSVTGVAFQAIFRNPLCDPYILGVSSGASIGAVLAFVLGWHLSLFGVCLPALITALLTLLLIFIIANITNRKTTSDLLLMGVAFNFLISAVITLLIVLNEQEMSKIIFWTMGSFGNISWKYVTAFIPVWIFFIFPLFYYSKDLNIMQLGTETAKTLGINTFKVSSVVLISSSILIAIVVSLCGIIGFVGLVVPHIARLLVGNQQRGLMIYSIFIGAAMLLLADTLARTLALPSELPVGSITALLGTPLFLYLLLRKHN
jgi:iron complex transport system permease protein